MALRYFEVKRCGYSCHIRIANSDGGVNLLRQASYTESRSSINFLARLKQDVVVRSRSSFVVLGLLGSHEANLARSSARRRYGTCELRLYYSSNSSAIGAVQPRSSDCAQKFLGWTEESVPFLPDTPEDDCCSPLRMAGKEPNWTDEDGIGFRLVVLVKMPKES